MSPKNGRFRDDNIAFGNYGRGQAVEALRGGPVGSPTGRTTSLTCGDSYAFKLPLVFRMNYIWMLLAGQKQIL